MKDDEKAKKYKLTGETREIGKRTLYRIEACKSFAIKYPNGRTVEVSAGEKGGWVESENNLSQDGNCWVADDAYVMGDAKVHGNALITGKAMVAGNAEVYGYAVVGDYAVAAGYCKIYESAVVCQHAKVRDYAELFGICHVLGNASVSGHAKIYEYANVAGTFSITDNVKIKGMVCLDHAVRIKGDAEIASIEDYMIFHNTWSSGREFIWTRSNDMWNAGCFYGTGEELVKKAYEDSETSGKCYQKTVEYVEYIKETSATPGKNGPDEKTGMMLYFNQRLQYYWDLCKSLFNELSRDTSCIPTLPCEELTIQTRALEERKKIYSVSTGPEVSQEP